MQLVFATSALLAVLFGMQASFDGKEQIRIVPVARTVESNTVILKVAVPEMGAVVNNPVWIQFRIDGYALGTNSQFDRADEVANSDMGQTIHVVVDNYPYIAVNEPAIDPFNEEGWYYDTSYKFEVPFRLKEGMHTIRMFPARSFGEALKGENTFAESYFYVGSRKDNAEVDLSSPYITYNEPSEQVVLNERQPALLDFYVSNCELSSDGYKVRLTVDGKAERLLTSWQPYYIYGMRRGRHTVRLELIDKSGKRVGGAYNDIKRTVTVS